MNRLRQILQREIAAQGVIPFSRFMELALYCPELGYYERPQARIGRHGDFYTSVSVGGLLGELLAHQFADWLGAIGATNYPEPFSEGKLCLVEAGAHDAALARDILQWMREHRPAIYEQLEYWIVEPHRARIDEQQRTLEEFAEKIRWYETVAELPAVRGVIFSNELLDAFPVNRYIWHATERTWREAGVAFDGERFAWREIPLAVAVNRGGGGFLADLGLQIDPALLDILPDGHTIDISSAATEWWREAARKLSRGKLLTIDYGLTAEQFLAPERSTGTLRGYYKHRQTTDLFANVGEQDLTAHVNFTALQRAGEAEGLHTDRLLSQEKFLSRIAQKVLSVPSNFSEWTPERTRQFQTLTHPNHLGHVFKVLLQSR